MLGIKQKIGDI